MTHLAQLFPGIESIKANFEYNENNIIESISIVKVENFYEEFITFEKSLFY